MLAVKVAGCDGTADGDGVVLKVNRAPLLPKDFTSTQAVKAPRKMGISRYVPFAAVESFSTSSLS